MDLPRGPARAQAVLSKQGFQRLAPSDLDRPGVAGDGVEGDSEAVGGAVGVENFTPIHA